MWSVFADLVTFLYSVRYYNPIPSLSYFTSCNFHSYISSLPPPPLPPPLSLSYLTSSNFHSYTLIAPLPPPPPPSLSLSLSLSLSVSLACLLSPTHLSHACLSISPPASPPFPPSSVARNWMCPTSTREPPARVEPRSPARGHGPTKRKTSPILFDLKGGDARVAAQLFQQEHCQHCFLLHSFEAVSQLHDLCAQSISVALGRL